MVIVDPNDYWSATERGFETRWTGDEIAQRGLINTGDHGASSGFWNPPHSEWLLGRPEQFDPYWFKNEGYAANVQRADMWDFASLVAPNVTEFPWRNTPDETYDDDQAINLGQIPLGLGTPPISLNLTNLGTAAGFALPIGIGVVAATKNANVAGVTPFFQWVRQPEPQDIFLFGFGEWAVLTTDRQVIVLRSPDGGTSWVKVGDFGGFTLPKNSSSQGAFTSASHTMQMRQLMVIPVGWNQFYLMRHASDDPMIVTTRQANTIAQKASGTPWQNGAGKLWVAAYPGQKTLFQAQPMVYRNAEHIELGSGTIDNDTSKPWFSTTPAYSPSVAPQIVVDAITHGTLGRPVTTSMTAGQEYLDPNTLEAFQVQVVNASHAAWIPGVGNFRGAVRVAMTAAIAPGMTATLTPQIRSIEMRFPPVITARAGANVTLLDTQFKPIKIEADLHDPESKKITIPLKPAAIALLEAAGIEDWENMPVEVWEDTDADGDPDVLRAAGWVKDPSNRGYPSLSYSQTTLEAVGMLLGRGDKYFHFRHHLAAWVEGGRLDHATALSSVLLQCGFDVTDTDRVEFESDTADADVRYLPGGAAEEPGEAGQKRAPAYSPDWDETRLEYMLRIARTWRKWILTELLNGKITYRHDVVDDLIDLGTSPTSEATFYKTHAAATAAGVHSQQVYMAGFEQWATAVKANFVRIIPPTPDLAHIIDRDTASISDTTADNYVGEEIPAKPWQPTLAAAADPVYLARLAILARQYLRRLRRRITGHTWNSLCAPWQVLPSGVDVGSVVTLEDRGLHRITKVEVQQLSRAIFLTSWTAEKLPPPTVF